MLIFKQGDRHTSYEHFDVDSNRFIWFQTESSKTAKSQQSNIVDGRYNWRNITVDWNREDLFHEGNKEGAIRSIWTIQKWSHLSYPVDGSLSSFSGAFLSVNRKGLSELSTLTIGWHYQQLSIQNQADHQIFTSEWKTVA